MLAAAQVARGAGAGAGGAAGGAFGFWTGN